MHYSINNNMVPILVACGRKKCTLCKHMKVSKNFMDQSQNTYSTKGQINCLTENVIYGIFCNKCQKLLYVGETMNSLYARHVQNFSRIRNKANLNDLTHRFTKNNDHELSDYHIVGVEKISQDDIFRKTYVKCIGSRN